MSDIVYREMTLPDIEQVYAIECSCFSQPWSVESLIGELVRNETAHYVVAESDGRIIGYAGIWVLIDEAHMTNIAVIPEYRRMGVATGIILTLMRYARSRNAVRMTLEVREHNYKAQNLYFSLDFAQAGIRKRYYSDTGESALILWNNDIAHTIDRYQNGSGHLTVNR